MKVSFEPPLEEFTPFDVTFTIQSMDDAATLYAIFNHLDIARFLRNRGWNPGNVRHGITSRINTIDKSVSAHWYGKTHEQLLKFLGEKE